MTSFSDPCSLKMCYFIVTLLFLNRYCVDVTLQCKCLFSFLSLDLYLHRTPGFILDGSFGLRRESEIDEVNAEGFQSLCDVKTGQRTRENDCFVHS